MASRNTNTTITRRVAPFYNPSVLLHCVIFHNAEEIINTRAPISMLTQDVLSVIFHEVHPEDLASPEPRGIWSPQSIPVPLCLSHVSETWNDVITNLPTLWTTVKITTPRSIPSVETCLSMSKSLPINLEIKALKWKPRAFFADRSGCYHEDGLFEGGTPRLTDVRYSVDALSLCHPRLDSVTTLSLRGSNRFSFYEVPSILSQFLALESLVVYGGVFGDWIPSPH
jgi:hypothetical protein